MSFNSLKSLVSALPDRPGWQEQKALQHILALWPAIVGSQVNDHTQPLRLQGDVLHVATASAVWSQSLMFERQRLVERLNASLAKPIRDIHFSTASWAGQRCRTTPLAEAESWVNHPSYVAPSSVAAPRKPLTASPDPLNAQTSFQQWADRVKARTQHLPLCPHCYCPTPQGELQRWQVCALCHRQTTGRHPL